MNQVKNLQLKDKSSDWVVISVDTYDKWSIVLLTESKVFSWNIIFVLYLDNIRYTTFAISEIILLQIFIVFHSSYEEKGAPYRVTFKMLLQYFSSQKFQILEEWDIFHLF